MPQCLPRSVSYSSQNTDHQVKRFTSVLSLLILFLKQGLKHSRLDSNSPCSNRNRKMILLFLSPDCWACNRCCHTQFHEVLEIRPRTLYVLGEPLYQPSSARLLGILITSGCWIPPTLLLSCICWGKHMIPPHYADNVLIYIHLFSNI